MVLKFHKFLRKRKLGLRPHPDPQELAPTGLWWEALLVLERKQFKLD